MTRTHIILDGLQDTALGRDLSARWAAAGFTNGVDVAGQRGWLGSLGSPQSTVHGPQSGDKDWKSERHDSKVAGPRAPSLEPQVSTLTEGQMNRAAAIARAFGLEIRDRAGRSFRPDNDLETLRGRLVYEYKSRFATALMFGLPALALHYVGPFLAGGTGEARSQFYPWMIEFLLVGWVCIAAGWPILWQGLLALVHLRVTADLLTGLVVVAAFIGSAVGVLATPWARQWWGLGSGPMFHAVDLAVTMAVLQRWLAHRAAPHLSGKTPLMIPSFSKVVGFWLCLSLVVWWFDGGEAGLATALIFPPLSGLGSINRWSPGLTFLLPTVAFAALLLVGPRALSVPVDGVHIEIAAGFCLIMTITMGLGWAGEGGEERREKRAAPCSKGP